MLALIVFYALHLIAAPLSGDGVSQQDLMLKDMCILVDGQDNITGGRGVGTWLEWLIFYVIHIRGNLAIHCARMMHPIYYQKYADPVLSLPCARPRVRAMVVVGATPTQTANKYLQFPFTTQLNLVE